MAKKKTGLHKKISSIFDGISVPKTNSSPPAAAPREHKKTSTGIPSELPAGFGSQSARPAVSKPSAPKKTLRPMSKKASGLKTQPAFRQKNKFKLSNPMPGTYDRNNKVKLALIPVLFLVLIFVVIPKLKSDSSNPKTSKRGIAITPKIQKNLNAKINWDIPKPYPKTIRDPMNPGSNPGSYNIAGNDANSEIYGTNALGIDVRSILFSEERSSAVIGDELEIVYEGDTVLGVTIIKINQNSVEFEKDGLRFTRYVQY